MPFKRIFAEEKLGLSNAFDVARQRVISMVALNTEKLGLSNALDVARQRVISIAALNTEKLGLSDATVAMATISHMLEIIENVAIILAIEPSLENDITNILTCTRAASGAILPQSPTESIRGENNDSLRIKSFAWFSVAYSTVHQETLSDPNISSF
ncbi:hypothetical protein BDC45DRAFT_586174 [Circinella umbellata]|nr:hypothetical protein BDC45DRAFT_586174 [Circinella umbellata]